MSEIEKLAARLAEFSEQSKSVGTHIGAAAASLGPLARRAESLRGSGVDTAELADLIRTAHTQATSAADAAGTVARDGKAWAAALARSGGGASTDEAARGTAATTDQPAAPQPSRDARRKALWEVVKGVAAALAPDLVPEIAGAIAEAITGDDLAGEVVSQTLETMFQMHEHLGDLLHLDVADAYRWIRGDAEKHLRRKEPHD